MTPDGSPAGIAVDVLPIAEARVWRPGRWVFVGVLVWLAIMFVLSGTDYFTR